jgi:LemA protein
LGGGKMTPLIVVVVLVFGAIFILAGMYNSLVQLRVRADSAWSDIDVQLKRRHDLIPNLVETVKGYAAHEEGVFKDIADSRAKLLAAKTPEETIQAANQQTGALGRLLAISENYPQLKANEQFNRLMDELAVERQRYNERIQEYNTATKQFPANITAKVFGFKEYPFFQAPPEATQVPKVNFNKPS